MASRLSKWLTGANLPSHPGMTAAGLSTDDKESDEALKAQFERRQKKIKRCLSESHPSAKAIVDVLTGRTHNS